VTHTDSSSFQKIISHSPITFIWCVSTASSFLSFQHIEDTSDGPQRDHSVKFQVNGSQTRKRKIQKTERTTANEPRVCRHMLHYDDKATTHIRQSQCRMSFQRSQSQNSYTSTCKWRQTLSANQPAGNHASTHMLVLLTTKLTSPYQQPLLLSVWMTVLTDTICN